MKVFVTGAAGWIGSHVVPELIAHGHTIVGLSRSEGNTAAIRAMGGEVLEGDLKNVESIVRGAKAADAIIHLGFIHDFTDFENSCKTDTTVVKAVCDAIKGTEKPFIITSGTAALDPSKGDRSTEEDRVQPTSFGYLRSLSEDAIFDAAATDKVNGMVIRLPPSIHGTNDQGFVKMVIGIAREKGVSAYVGDGTDCWPVTHVKDVAVLYRLALEKGTAGAVYHGVGEEAVPLKTMAEAIGKGTGLEVVSKKPEEAMGHFGWLFGTLFSKDSKSSSKLTKEKLSWTPTQPTLLEDLAESHYFS